MTLPLSTDDAQSQKLICSKFYHWETQQFFKALNLNETEHLQKIRFDTVFYLCHHSMTHDSVLFCPRMLQLHNNHI